MLTQCGPSELLKDLKPVTKYEETYNRLFKAVDAARDSLAVSSQRGRTVQMCGLSATSAEMAGSARTRNLRKFRMHFGR